MRSRRASGRRRPIGNLLAGGIATMALTMLTVLAFEVTLSNGRGISLETTATTLPAATDKLEATEAGSQVAPIDHANNERGLDGTDGLAGLNDLMVPADVLQIQDVGQPTTSIARTSSDSNDAALETTGRNPEGDGSTPPSGPTTTEPAVTGTPSPSSTRTPGGGGDRCFAPAFRDDFNRSEIGPDWGIYTTVGSHSPHAVRRAEAISLVDGKLVITAKNDADGVLASGGLRHLGSQTYGRYSARVRTDADLTNATSGVILTWPISGDQPRDGENNMYETLKAPGARWPFYSFIHEPFDDRADGVSQTRFVFEADATQWQEMTMVWTPDFIEITRSGPGATQTETKRIDETEADRISDAEHFLSVQFDLFKGSFPDDRQRRMEVDWVQIERWCGG